MALSQAPAGLQTVFKRCTPHLSAVHIAAAQLSLTQSAPQRRAVGLQTSAEWPSVINSLINMRCMAASSDMTELIEQKNTENDVVIFSKSYCPFSGEVKQLFKKLKVEYKSFELDEIVEGDDILDALVDKTSSRTVPQVFIKGQYIGGADDTLSKYKSGKLKEIFDNSGVSASF